MLQNMHLVAHVAEHFADGEVGRVHIGRPAPGRMAVLAATVIGDGAAARRLGDKHGAGRLDGPQAACDDLTRGQSIDRFVPGGTG